MTNEQRSAVAEYFSVYKGSDHGKKARLRLPVVHSPPAGETASAARLLFAAMAAAAHSASFRLKSSPTYSPAAQVALPSPLHPALARAADTVLTDYWLNARALPRPARAAPAFVSIAQPEESLLGPIVLLHPFSTSL